MFKVSISWTVRFIYKKKSFNFSPPKKFNVVYFSMYKKNRRFRSNVFQFHKNPYTCPKCLHCALDKHSSIQEHLGTFFELFKMWCVDNHGYFPKLYLVRIWWNFFLFTILLRHQCKTWLKNHSGLLKINAHLFEWLDDRLYKCIINLFHFV